MRALRCAHRNLSRWGLCEDGWVTTTFSGGSTAAASLLAPSRRLHLLCSTPQRLQAHGKSPTAVKADQHTLPAEPAAAASPMPSSTDSTPAPSQALLILSAADGFAQSRIKNYMQRILATPAPAGTKPASSADRYTTSVADVMPRRLTDQEKAQCEAHVAVDKAWVAQFHVPVDVLVNDRLARHHLRVAGVAMEPKAAILAACMHAERCLDELHVPLFTSVQRQHQRVLQAQAEGRTAAEASDVPREWAAVALPPFAVLPSGAATSVTQRLASYQPNKSPSSGASHRRGGGAGAEAAGTGNAPDSQGASGGTAPQRHLHHQQQQQRQMKPPQRRRPRRRFDNFSARFGSDPFLQAVSTDLATLQSTLFAHNRPLDEDEDDEAAEERARVTRDMAEVNITGAEVAVLQPELLPRKGEEPADWRSGGRTAHTGPTLTTANVGHAMMLEMKPSGRDSPRCARGPDESEGGVYDLVEGNDSQWVTEVDVPGPACVRDPYAVRRVDQYLQRVSGHTVEASVQIHFSDEDTFYFLEDKGTFGVRLKRWYTASMELPELGVRATGKASTQRRAIDLCAMHAELLLQWFGVPIYTAPHAQAKYYDACVRWGRHVAAAPVDPAEAGRLPGQLPKPLKEWFRTSKARVRRAEMNVTEKLLRLNRIVVHLFRKHLVEVDLFATDKYTELLSLCETCVRSFLVAMQHPYEGAYFNYIYQQDAQFRTTLYLPLPERYGIRGGYAIATTPQRGVLLCALSAVDVLCALDVIPDVCLRQPQWQRMLELRDSLGLFLPPSYQYKKRLEQAPSAAARAALGPPPPPPHVSLRSPPSYREAPELSSDIPPHEEVWRVMLLDVDVFDIIPSAADLELVSFAMSGGVFGAMPQALFEDIGNYLFSWNCAAHEQRQHMYQYTGPQRHGNKVKTFANNFWMRLPLEESVYGVRVALGRCQSRKGAERAMYIHALRILRALKLVPFDTMTLEEVTAKMYHHNAHLAIKQARQWKWLCDAVLDGKDMDELDRAALQSTPEAVITKETVLSHEQHAGEGAAAAAPTTGDDVTDMRRVLSPNPVMTKEMAKLTFR